MLDHREFSFSSLATANLVVDALYKGGIAGNAADDPISKLTGTGNQGGFRYIGNKSAVRLCVLYSSSVEVAWPDQLDLQLGLFTYYGDNRSPGHELHARKGNHILSQTFEHLHAGQRGSIPPYLIFTKAEQGRDVIFRGLAVPGARQMNTQEDLVAIWRSANNQRFQNYRATFTILREPVIAKEWLTDLRNGRLSSSLCPKSWLTWVKTGVYDPLVAPPIVTYRNSKQQIPAGKEEFEIVRQIVSYFKAHPNREYAFEGCAAEIVMLMDKNITEYELTRFWRDGGRDAIGKYRIGTPDSSIYIDFALEAKCKGFEHGSGIEETSRLISRLKHRQFGIFVTTSYVSEQAYKEITEDQHPVMIVCGADIARILTNAGYPTKDKVGEWLKKKFPY